jgi:hypothetical protein
MVRAEAPGGMEFLVAQSGLSRPHLDRFRRARRAAREREPLDLALAQICAIAEIAAEAGETH